MAQQDRREALITAARDVLSQYGFKKTTVEDIAARAGLAKASAYYYFKGKEEILSAVIQRESETLLKRMRDAMEAEESPEERLVALIRARYEFWTELRTIPHLNPEVFLEVSPQVRKEREAFFESEVALFEEVLKLGVKNGDFRVDNLELTSLAILSGLQGLDHAFMTLGRHEQISQGIAGLTRLLLDGLRKR